MTGAITRGVLHITGPDRYIEIVAKDMTLVVFLPFIPLSLVWILRAEGIRSCRALLCD